MIVGGIPMLFGGFVAPPGQQAYTTGGTFSWTCPPGVTSVSVVCVGAGCAGVPGNGGGGGGELGYKNNISVIPGTSYTLVVPAADSGDRASITIAGVVYSVASAAVGSVAGGNTQPFANTNMGGGGFGGTGGANSVAGGGGGAGGYSGRGGTGGGNTSDGANGAGGGGGGGYGSTTSAGGGVGILGEGSNGAGGTSASQQGKGGSGGGSGVNGTAGAFGGASGSNGGSAAQGAVRIIWPGTTRSFPSTLTGDL